MARGLVIVDIQKDYFPGGAHPLEGPEAAAASAARLLQGSAPPATPSFTSATSGTCDLEFGGQTIPAASVHAAFLAALADGYAAVVSTDDVAG